MVGDDDTLAAGTAEGTIPTSTSGAPVAERVAGRYQIVRWLGGGGMGRVYEVLDTELDERIALKMLRAGLSDEALERFRREVRLTRKIQHPNVARMFDIGEHAGDKFLTMELVEGDPLTRVVGQRMAWPRLQQLAVQICAGLAAAHARGVVHRDLKPDNVMIERGTDRVVLTDFGIAHSVEDPTVTQIGAVIGTPRYMAPEQLAGDPIDARADLFSLGVMLFEIATGTRPWSGDTVVAIAVAQATQPPRPLVSSSVPPELATLIGACLAIDREQRPASAAAIGEAIAAMGPVADQPSASRGSQPALVGVQTPRGNTIGSIGSGEAVPQETALAVLGFACAPGDEYLADGVREDLIDTLSVTAGLRVRPAGAAAAEPGADPRTVGAGLAVDHVVVGSLRRSPAGLRISARLIGVADGFQIWAHRVDCAEAAVLAVSEQLGQAIATALSTRAARQDRPTDPRAVELYLRGRAELRKFWGDYAEGAFELLEQAAAISPDSPSILSYYAWTAVQAWVKTNKPELLPRARAIVERALPLDHHEVYLASSVLRTNLGELEAGAADLGIALRRAPMSSLVHEIAGRTLCELSSGPEARQHFETAIALDPSRAPVIANDLARIDALEGDLLGAERRLAALRDDDDVEMRQIGAMLQTRLAVWHRDPERMFAALGGISPRVGSIASRVGQLVQLVKDWAAGKPFDMALWAGAIKPLQEPGMPLRMPLLSYQRAAEVAMMMDQPDRAIEAIARASEIGLVDVVWFDRCPLFVEVAQDLRFRVLRDAVAERAGRVLAAMRSGVRPTATILGHGPR